LQFSDRVVMMEDGRIAGDGIPKEVLNPTSIEAVFGVRTILQLTPEGRSWMAYEG
jgi:ABC-type hemin transport system ATPase subunit